MIRAMILVAVIASCKGGDKSASSAADPSSGGSCKPSPKLCAAMPAAGLAKLFEMPELTIEAEENASDSPAGTRAECRYKHDGDNTSLHLTLILACSNFDAKAEFAGIKRALTNAGAIDDVTGLGDEAFWSHSGTSTIPFVEGFIKARKGSLVVDVLTRSYQINGAMTSETAKQRAIEAAKKLFAVAP